MYDKGNEPMMDYGLNNEEVRELQAQLDADEFEALLQVQRQLLDTPMAAPTVDFANRVMTRLAVHERQQDRRRSALGAVGFISGSLIVAALAIWTSPLGTLVQVSGWTALLDNAISLLGVGTTVFVIALSFAGALFEAIGSASLVLFALLTLALTLIWTRLVAGPGPLNRPGIAQL